jgi:hypothetical protein
MSLDDAANRALTIDFLESLGYEVGTETELASDQVPMGPIGIYKPVKVGCIGQFFCARAPTRHMATLDLSRRSIKVYGAPILEQMTELKHRLEELYVMPLRIFLEDDEPKYVN